MFLRISMCCALLSYSAMPDSFGPHGMQPARLLCPWGFSRQEQTSGLPRPPPGDSSPPRDGTQVSLRQNFYGLSHQGSPTSVLHGNHLTNVCIINQLVIKYLLNIQYAPKSSLCTKPIVCSVTEQVSTYTKHGSLSLDVFYNMISLTKRNQMSLYQTQNGILSRK